jgi:cyanate lyase
MSEKELKIKDEESKKKDSEKKKKKEEEEISTKKAEESLVRASAFRAVNLTSDQPVPANAFVKVIFPTVQFDLATEYNPATSTFIPAKNGVYSVLSTIGFIPSDPNVNYRTRIEIRVNGNPANAIDNDFFGAGVLSANAIQVSTILQLQANEHVEVFATNSTPGIIISTEDGSRFEAARFPSQTD